MFIFCRNIGLSILNILSVLVTNKIKRDHFYVYSISVRYASRAHIKKMEEIKWYNSHLTIGCIETQDDIHKLLILEKMSLNCAHCLKIFKVMASFMK